MLLLAVGATLAAQSSEGSDAHYGENVDEVVSASRDDMQADDYTSDEDAASQLNYEGTVGELDSDDETLTDDDWNEEEDEEDFFEDSLEYEADNAAANGDRADRLNKKKILTVAEFRDFLRTSYSESDVKGIDRKCKAFYKQCRTKYCIEIARVECIHDYEKIEKEEAREEAAEKVAAEKKAAVNVVEGPTANA